MAIEKILVIEQDESVRGVLQRSLAQFEVSWASTLAEAQFSAHSFDLILAGGRPEDWNALMDRVSSLVVQPVIVIITDAAARANATACVRRGASAYLLKPFSQEDCEAALVRAAWHDHQVRVCRHLSAGGHNQSILLGESFASNQLRSVLSKIAQTNIPVLIRGESGVGKETLARAIHQQGPRSSGPFIKVDCAAVLPEQLEQQLFGWKSGRERWGEGSFELAAGGTLFIEEVSMLPSDVQTKLLRAIQQKKFQRMGGSADIPLNARVVASTSCRMEEKVKQGAFNEELFFALNVVPIWVPPLRERTQDIRVLSNYFIGYFSRKHGLNVSSISSEGVAALERNGWPGNIRQLESELEQAVLRCGDGSVQPEHFNGCVEQSAPENGTIESLELIEKRHILWVLARCNGNRTAAAKRLGISIRTIRNKLKAYRMQAGGELLSEAA